MRILVAAAALMVFPVLVPAVSALQAQSAAAPSVTPLTAPAKAVPDAFAAESFVIQLSAVRYVMNADGTGYRERTQAYRLQSDAALREASVVSVPFASASEHVVFEYVRARRPDGTVVDTPLTGVMEQPEQVTREAPFYSDLKEAQLPVKSLQVGDTLEWKARIVRTKAEAAGNFWGQETFTTEAVALEESVELWVPKGTAVTAWSNERTTKKPVERDEGDQHVYRWVQYNVQPTTGPKAELYKEDRKKHVLTPEEEQDARLGKLPSVAWTTFKSWAAVGEWYRGLELSRVTPDDAIKAKVASLVAGKTTEEDKVRAVYGFVAPQIRYIGVSFGVGRYQPHPADEVLDNQYGDCKDKHTLLASMLTVLGLQPDAVLIGQGVRFNQAVPSPAAFNHLITQVPVAGKPVWLDATAEVAPYQMLAYNLRDREALVIPAAGTPRIEKTPVDPPFASYSDMEAVGKIDKDGISDSRITFTLRGDGELLLRETVRQIPAARYAELVQQLSRSIGYSGTTSNPEITRPEDTSGPFKISYDYHREQGADWSNTRFVAQLEPLTLPTLDDKEPLTRAGDLGVARTEHSTAVMKIPAGWTAQLPEAVHKTSPWATYDLSYKFENGTVQTDRKLVVLQPLVPVADWSKWKKFTDAIGYGTENYIVLVRSSKDAVGTGGKAGKAAVPAAPSNAEAAELIQQAFDTLRTMDTAKANLLLEQARRLNPTQARLHAAVGYAAYLQGERNRATEEYKTEVALHPAEPEMYPMLAELQFEGKHQEDAYATLRAWAAVDPTNPAPVVTQVNALLTENNAAGALDAAKAGLAAFPKASEARKNPALQLAYGKAQLRAGETPAGAETLTALLTDSDDPLMLNDAAYELADANTQLPAAEAATRKALASLVEESRTWTLNEDPATLKQKSSMTVATWDTLGWVLFREGKNDAAEAQVNAAWHNQPNAVVGEHLGDIKAAQGNSSEALRSYDLALSFGPRGELGERLKKKRDAEKKLGGKTERGEHDAELLAMRTLKLGPAAGRDGAAEYRVLISHEGVVKAQAAGDKSVKSAEEIIRKADVQALVPAGSEAYLARLAILNCHAGTCDLILEP